MSKRGALGMLQTFVTSTAREKATSHDYILLYCTNAELYTLTVLLL